MSYEIDLKIAPELLAVMRQMVGMATEQLKQAPNSLPALHEDDPEMEYFWQEDLQAALSNDLELFQRTLAEGGLGEQPIKLEEAELEGLVRACSAIRVKVRETALKSISDETLEYSDIDLLKQPLEVQQAYSFYLFLSAIQSAFISYLDPESNPWFSDEDEDDDDEDYDWEEFDEED